MTRREVHGDLPDLIAKRAELSPARVALAEHATGRTVTYFELDARAAAAAAPVTASSRTDDIPASWDERTVLATMLDYVRDTVHVKCAGLTDEQGRRAPLPGSPLTTIPAW